MRIPASTNLTSAVSQVPDDQLEEFDIYGEKLGVGFLSGRIGERIAEIRGFDFETQESTLSAISDPPADTPEIDEENLHRVLGVMTTILERTAQTSNQWLALQKRLNGATLLSGSERACPPILFFHGGLEFELKHEDALTKITTRAITEPFTSFKMLGFLQIYLPPYCKLAIYSREPEKTSKRFEVLCDSLPAEHFTLSADGEKISIFLSKQHQLFSPEIVMQMASLICRLLPASEPYR